MSAASWLVTAALVTAALVTAALVIVGGYLFWRMSWFLRDPHREVPLGDENVVAAADGFVVYAKRIEHGQVPIAVKGRRRIALTEYAGIGSTTDRDRGPDRDRASGWLVGIYMTERSVHRNRAPLGGEVVLREHRPAAPVNRSMARIAANVMLRHRPYDDGCEHLLTNERLTIGIRVANGPIVFVTQIADLWINRIVARVTPGDVLGRGEQYGLIRFGSQCDVYLPDEIVERITVVPGQYVQAGRSVIAIARTPAETVEAVAAEPVSAQTVPHGQGTPPASAETVPAETVPTETVPTEIRDPEVTDAHH
jgi:phosphatidylserine decarboxylase